MFRIGDIMIIPRDKVNDRRYATYFLLEAVNNRTGKSCFFVAGWGKMRSNIPYVVYGECLYTGMSGCEDYEDAHVTCGGYHYLKRPTFNVDMDSITEEIRNREVELTAKEREALSEVLNKHKEKIVLELTKRGVIDGKTFLGVWEYVKKAVRWYRKGFVCDLPGGVKYVAKPDSYDGYLIVGKVIIKTRKEKPVVCDYEYAVEVLMDGLYIVYTTSHGALAMVKKEDDDTYEVRVFDIKTKRNRRVGVYGYNKAVNIVDNIINAIIAGKIPLEVFLKVPYIVEEEVLMEFVERYLKAMDYNKEAIRAITAFIEKKATEIGDILSDAEIKTKETKEKIRRETMQRLSELLANTLVS